jgi:hypothetical protein
LPRAWWPAAKSAVTFTRLAIMLEVMADRHGWPERTR